MLKTCMIVIAVVAVNNVRIVFLNHSIFVFLKRAVANFVFFAVVKWHFFISYSQTSFNRMFQLKIMKTSMELETCMKNKIWLMMWI